MLASEFNLCSYAKVKLSKAYLLLHVLLVHPATLKQDEVSFCHSKLSKVIYNA